MNKEEARVKAEMMLSWANGEALEYCSDEDENVWFPIPENPTFNGPASHYRKVEKTFIHKYISTHQDDVITIFGEGDTPEEAMFNLDMDEVAEDLELESGDLVDVSVYEQHKLTAEGLFSEFETERIIERLSESAYDEAGEVAEDYLVKLDEEVKNELHLMLKEAIKDWANKHDLHPKFWAVGKKVMSKEVQV